MNLFRDLRSNHGQETVTLAKDLEKVELKIARHRNHLVYSLRCKELGLTPPSLMIKSPINTKKAHGIIAKARKDLLRERIRIINNKLTNFKTDKEKIANELNNSLNPTEQRHLSTHVNRVKQTEFEKSKCRQIQKLERLQQKQKPPVEPEIDLSGSQLKRWVINLSKYKLSKSQCSVLSKGLNFAVSPDKLPVTEFIVATEQACQSLPNSEATVLRAEITGTLRGVKLPKSNVTSEERKALGELQKEKSITILPADKGKATVVMDSSEYEQKVKDMLSDTKTYEVLKSDPTNKCKKELMATLTRLLNESKISQDQYDHLRPSGEVIPRLYATPKIHKPNNPLRPIVDYTGSIGYNTSRALADILNPIVGVTEHHVSNSFELAEELCDVIIEEDEQFISHDVVSLFTNTPIDECLNIIRDRLDKDQDLKNRTLLNVDDIMELMKFILTTTYFTFRGTIYKQKFGAAMGSPVSPLTANIFMEWLEQNAIHSAPIHCKPHMWK